MGHFEERHGSTGTARRRLRLRAVLFCGLIAAVGLAGAQESDEIAADAAPGASTTLADESLSRLVANLRVEARHDRLRALHALVSEVQPEDVPALLEILKEPDTSIRVQWRLLRAVGMMGVAEAAPVAARIVEDPLRDEGVRQAAAFTLADLRARPHAKALKHAAQTDPTPLTRIIAAGALYRVMGKAALPELNRLKASESDPYAIEHLDWYAHLIRNGDTFTIRPRPGEIVTCALAGTKYLIYTPTTYQPGVDHELLVSVHGTFGSSERYMDVVRERAEAENLVAIAPWFEAATFPSFDNLNLDNIGIGQPRSDLRLLEIIDAVGKMVSVRTDQFYLFGHSKGGQFTQRFVFAHPDRIIRAAACASGLYLAPEEETKGGYGEMFPYGAVSNPFAPDLAERTFEGFIAAPIAFFVGTKDPRVADLHRFVRESQARARKVGYTPQLEVRLLASVGHDGRETFPPAADYLFGE